MLFLTFFTLLTLFTSLTSAATIILKPPSRSNVTQYDAALVFIQGANIPAKDYTQFSLQLQNKFNGNLWVALTEFVGNLPEPVLINSVVNGAFADLQKSGLKLTAKTPVFFAGHSLGGAMIQDFLIKNDKYATLPVYVAGIILEGAFVTRSNRDKSLQTQKPPILTLGAELDGLCRITRMSESFFFDQNTQPFARVTIVVRGMNHYQFSGEGNPPSFVVKNDIKPEISNESARDQITSIVNSFMQISLSRATQQDTQLITNAVQDTQTLVSPLIQALQLEGFYHFEPPCYKTHKDPSEKCFLGSPWTQQFSQNILANTQSGLDVADTFFIVYEPPEHLPKIHNQCSSPSSCVLNITTVSQNVYSLEDALDTGLQPVAAEEIRTKLASRQAVLLAATGKKYDFNDTDGASLCALINNESMKWALKAAPLQTVQRYLRVGVPLVTVDDVQESAGPLWIWNPLSFKKAVDQSTQKPYVALRSPMMKYPVDYSIKAVSGIHYCKVLSPARAMEWFYVDSLKPQESSLLSSVLQHLPYGE